MQVSGHPFQPEPSLQWSEAANRRVSLPALRAHGSDHLLWPTLSPPAGSSRVSPPRGSSHE
jgi:hypothetical protein